MSRHPPLARDRFDLPDGLIYLDGNSLGPLPRATAPRLAEVVSEEWGRDLITSWNRHGWIDMNRKVATRLAPIVGAMPEELLITDSTSITLYKALGAAEAAVPARSVIVTQEGNFPTDLYVLEGLAKSRNLDVRVVPADAILQSINEEVCVVVLTHVDFRSGRRHDMDKVNAAAHDAGALTVWDLSHSAGALSLDLTGSGCDFAVGCGYKYLNGGPGAPAFLYVAKELHDRVMPPILGWFGHTEPFAFSPEFKPALGINRFATGTPPILSLAALDCGIATFQGIAIADIEEGSAALSEAFIAAVERHCGIEVRLASPRLASQRGSHVVFAHDEGYAIVQALIERGVIGDFRAPDLMRFGFCPLYNSVDEVERAAEILGDVIRSGDWNRRRFQERARVT